MRNLGGAIGIAMAGTLLNDRANLHFLRLAEHLTPANPAMTAMLDRVAGAEAAARGLDAAHAHQAALKLLWALTLREAQTMTFADIFLAILSASSSRPRWCP